MSEQALHSKRPWRAVLARRRWRSGYNAGGSPAYIGTIIKQMYHLLSIKLWVVKKLVTNELSYLWIFQKQRLWILNFTYKFQDLREQEEAHNLEINPIPREDLLDHPNVMLLCRSHRYDHFSYHSNFVCMYNFSCLIYERYDEFFLFVSNLHSNMKRTF